MTRADWDRSEVLLGAVGDVFVKRSNPRSAFAYAQPAFDEVDVLFGNCEGVYTDKPDPPAWDTPVRMIADRQMAEGPVDAGFTVMSLANNHIMDGGVQGLRDVISELGAGGIKVCGAGLNSAEAHRSTVIESTAGRGRIAYLAFTCVYPAGSRSGTWMAGVAALRTHTVYDPPNYLYPGAPPQISVALHQADMNSARELIAAQRADCDFVVVSLHMGGVLPIEIADYEKAYARLAIEAGADVVFAHHHHLLRGVDFHLGRPIFHGLGHFVFDMVRGPMIEESWYDRMRDQYGEWGVYPRPGYPLLPFPPDARMTALALCRLRAAGGADVGYVPFYIEPDGAPRLLSPTSGTGQQVAEYMAKITEHEDLRATFEIDTSWTVGGVPVVRALPLPAEGATWPT